MGPLGAPVLGPSALLKPPYAGWYMKDTVPDGVGRMNLGRAAKATQGLQLDPAQSSNWVSSGNWICNPSSAPGCSSSHP